MTRWPDLAVIGLFFSTIIFIGFRCARKNKSSEAYFLAERSLPGWAVGFSLMATLISSLSFLALPAFTYGSDWRWNIECITYPIIMLVALKWFIPFYRKAHYGSAYEYLEQRFGIWARVYVSIGFILTQFLRMGLILYSVSLVMKAMFGLGVPWIILIFGIVVLIYAVLGGLLAIIWTDVVQGTALMVGGLICLPIMLHHLPGGFAQIIQEALAAVTPDGTHKMSLGPTELTLSSMSRWVVFLSTLVMYAQWACTDQMFVQRYCAPKSEREARKSLCFGVCSSALIWIYFSFIGTALWVFYRTFPSPDVANMKAEEIFPFWILSQVPLGLAGFVVAGLIMAALSTLDSSINASAQTVVADYYRRLLVKDANERHYVWVGRCVSIVFGAVMIGVAMVIHFTRTKTLVEINAVFIGVFGSGLLAIFLLGFATKRATSNATLIATACTLVGVTIWLFLDSDIGAKTFPQFEGKLPHKLWINVFSNMFLFVLAYAISLVLKRDKKRCDG